MTAMEMCRVHYASKDRDHPDEDVCAIVLVAEERGVNRGDFLEGTGQCTFRLVEQPT